MTLKLLRGWRAIETDPALDTWAPGTLPNLAVTRILVPLDFSHCSRVALGYALSFASHFKAELFLFHVFEPVAPELKVLESVFVDPSFREQARRELEEWRGRVPAELPNQAVFREAKSAYREILNAASELDVQLIVLGRHGRRGLERLVMGSTAERVIRHAHCAVLVPAAE